VNYNLCLIAQKQHVVHASHAVLRFYLGSLGVELMQRSSRCNHNSSVLVASLGKRKWDVGIGRGSTHVLC
jgi:hypothetical protein